MGNDEGEFEAYDGSCLKKILDTVNPTGTFACDGTFKPESLSPKISMDGVGTVGLPLHSVFARYITETVAEKAPFGRGPATLVDESVRKAWQIDPNKVTLSGEAWDETVADIVKEACYKLGISNENVRKLGIEAHLYKVLLYEEGGHFKPHKDTVKEEGMFGTLVLQLPSVFKGSDSHVVHQGQKLCFELSKDSEASFRYMAFYADCTHEILPVTEGVRFCMVYNLVVTNPSPNGVVPDACQMEKTVTELQIEATKWFTSGTGKLGYCLDHEYTLHSFGFGKLKGRDAVVMSALRNAKDEAGNRIFDVSR